MFILYHLEIKVYIAYRVTNLYTGFNKTGFDKQLLGIIDFLYYCFILKCIKSNPMYNFIQKSIKMKISVIFLYAFLFNLISLSILIYFITLKLEYCTQRGYIFTSKSNILLLCI